MEKKHSSWLSDCLKQIQNNDEKTVLDVACGYGRNSLLLANLGFKVHAVDNDKKKLSQIIHKNIYKKQLDVENVNNWPVSSKKFDIIIIFNFLFRPIFPHIINSINKKGYLIYETFATGHSRFGPPSNKNFLLKKKELIKLTKPLSLLAYEEIQIQNLDSCFKKQRIFSKNV